MTDENIKGLLAKAWKDEALDLEPGRHYCDEVLSVRVTGTIEKKEDEFAAPTVSIPLIPTLALFWEKCGVLQPIMPLDLPVKVRPWELTVYPRSHIRR